MERPSSQRGSAIIMLFIAVALFGALAYAFMQGSRTGLGWVEKEKSNAAATKIQDCSNTVNMATKRLAARGCGNLVSMNLDGTNTNPGAPTDGSCSVFHVNGGGVKACSMDACDAAAYAALTLGQSCNGITYVGDDFDGNRNYTVAADHGTAQYQNQPWPGVDAGGNSDTDGWDNTTRLLLQSPAVFPAAPLCRALGPKWYLPAWGELETLYFNRNVPELAGIIDTSGIYWSSTQFSNWDGFVLHMPTGNHPTYGTDQTWRIKCFYRP